MFLSVKLRFPSHKNTIFVKNVLKKHGIRLYFSYQVGDRRQSKTGRSKTDNKIFLDGGFKMKTLINRVTRLTDAFLAEEINIYDAKSSVGLIRQQLNNLNNENINDAVSDLMIANRRQKIANCLLGIQATLKKIDENQEIINLCDEALNAVKIYKNRGCK